PAPDLAGLPRQRRSTRQHVVEDGMHYPRPSIATLNSAGPGLFQLAGDPRFPAIGSPGAVPFVSAAAFDIRIDNRTNLIEFFEDRVDGVEFDEELGVESLLPAETNAIYVQVHNRGTATVVD